MNTTEIQKLAHAVNALRPDWLISSLTTFIARDLVKRPYRDVATALVWIATDMKPDGSPASDTPRRVLEAGPWWRAATIEHPDSSRPRNPTALTACRTCGRHLDDCICGERATRPSPPLDPEARRAAVNAVRIAAGYAPREDT